MIEVGKITNVWISPSGSELVEDAASGQALLVVDDAFDFNESGGSLRLSSDTATLDTTYIAVDMDTDTITLTSALADTWTAETKVIALPLGQQKKAQIDLADDDEGCTAIIPMSLDAQVDTGIREPDEQEAVLISDESGRWEVKSVDDQEATVMGSRVTGEGLPVAVPVDPPAVSPAIKRVTGTTNSLVVETEDVAAGTVIDYHISTIDGFTADSTNLFTTTQATVAVIDKMPDGSPLAVDTNYYIVTVAHNSIGSALPSAQESGSLNMANVSTLIAAQLVAGFILTGSIAVGQMTIDADTGITINAPGGGTILQFPVNGIDPLSMTAQIIAQALTVQGDLAISGNGVMYGDLLLANGIQTPSTAPTLASTWEKKTSFIFTDGSDRSDYFSDMTKYIADPQYMLVCMTYAALVGGGAGTTFALMDKDTGEFAGSPDGSDQGWSTNFFARGGICGGGADAFNNYYILGQDGDSNDYWYIYEIDSGDWTRKSSIRVATTRFGNYYPRIIWDENQGYPAIIWVDSANKIWYEQYPDIEPLANTPDTYGPLATLSGRSTIGAAYVGNAHVPTNWQLFLAIKNLSSQTDVMAFKQSTSTYEPDYIRDSTHDFPRPNSGKIQALEFDEDTQQMVSIRTSGDYYRYGMYTADRSIQAKYAWYDADATDNGDGLGTHETAVGPVKTFTLPARAQLSASVPPPPDALNTDPSNHDKANQVRLYLSDDSGATWKLQPFSASPWSTLLPSLDALTVATPGAGNPFPASVDPGDIRSSASDSGFDGFVEKAHMRGDGTFRFGNYTSTRHFGIRGKSSNQSIPASTVTLCTFGTNIEAPTGVSWDNNSSIQNWIINKPGIYHVIVSIEWDSTNVVANSRRNVGIYKNGSLYAVTDWSSLGFIQTLNSETEQCTALIPCVPGDKIDCRVYVGGGSGTPVIGGDSARTFFSIAFVSQ